MPICIMEKIMSGMRIFETYIHLYHHHKYFRHQVQSKMIDLTIYHDHLGYGRKIVCYEAYIHLSHHHQQFLQCCERGSGWSLDTFIKLLHHHHFNHHNYKLHDCMGKNGWSLET